MTKCSTTCISFTGQCGRRKECACKCGSLQSISIALHEGCVAACNSPTRPKDADDYLCNWIGAQELFSQYKILKCGLPIEETDQYKVGQVVKAEDEAAAKAAANTQRNIIIALFILIAVFGYIVFQNTNSK